MLDENIHHLPVVEEGKIIGVVSATDLLLHQGHNPLYLRGIIENWHNSHAVNYAEEIGTLVHTLFNSGLAAVHISKIVSSLNDALVKRLIALTVEKLGPAPTPFAWIVFGSEGRLEQTLLTDQDNALIFQDDSDTARAYFADLAKQVVDALIKAGFPPCAGGFMATHWCKPLAAWRELFSRMDQPAQAASAARRRDLFRFSLSCGNACAGYIGGNRRRCEIRATVSVASGARRAGFLSAFGILQSPAQ